MTSPYEGLAAKDWLAKTQDLISCHPLNVETIKEVALKSWQILWSTTIGEGELSINLFELDVPATVMGYFLEKLFAKEIERQQPLCWRGGRNKNDKDIVYSPNNFYSIEIKSSGQLGTKVFGNRSYGQNVENTDLDKKEKSGYYITVNFYGKELHLLQFGWIDHSDWNAQKAESGQAAGLSELVYTYKLIRIEGDYRLVAPIGILKGIGEKTSQDFAEAGVITIKDLKNYNGNNPKILKFREKLEDQGD